MINKKTAQQIATLTQNLRDFFTSQNFLEVTTPIMTPFPGMEPHLTPFETTLNTPHSKTPLYLNTSPELQMKKLLAQGFHKIFNITKTFRDTEIGGNTHNPEFTMLEWYRHNADYTVIMNDTEKLIAHLDPRFAKPFKRISVRQLFLNETNIDLKKSSTREALAKEAEALDLETQACPTWDDIFFKIFLNKIEPQLGHDTPTFVYDYPATQAALARKSQKDPFFAERFELYINGIELANAFSELIDAKEQRARLIEEQNQRASLNKTVFPLDEEFLQALESITKPCAGIALGLDRLFMVLLDIKSIEDIQFFPMTQMLNQLNTWKPQHQSLKESQSNSNTPLGSSSTPNSSIPAKDQPSPAQN